jgi:hydrogenase maturation protease
MKTLILALGNPILSDDAVGWEVAERLAARLPRAAYDIRRESGATFDLVRKLAGYDRLAVIDAIQLGTAPVGSVRRFALDDFQSTVRFSSAHDINFATAFETGRRLGCHIPSDIRIYAIEVKELLRFSEGCTPEVRAKLDEIAQQIGADLERG